MQIASNKIKDVIRFFKQELEGIYEDSEIDAFVAICFEELLNLKRSDLLLNGEKTMSESELLKFNFAIKDLKKQKPLQYILGVADFYGLKFNVNGSVLIPRPETEELVDLIIKDYKGKAVRILDIGTGSGCIPVSLKKNLPQSTMEAIDISEEALLVAKENAKMNDVDVHFSREDILHPDAAFKNLRYDVIVSNPPYIKESEKEAMHKNVLEHEPHLALFVYDTDALLFYKVIADHALTMLNPGGQIYFEINVEHDQESKQMLENKGFKNVVLIKDMSNKNRILRGSI